MFTFSPRAIAIMAAGAILAGSLAAAATPAHAVEPMNPVDIREWEVPYEGRARDPDVADPDTVWFVGQTTGYLARLTPSTGDFFKRDLEGRAGPHNLIVGNDGVVWFAGNLNAYIGRYDPETDEIERIEMPEGTAYDPHTMIFDPDQSHIWFTSQGANYVGRLSVADRSVDLIEVPTQGARPYGIKIATDGTPWIALFGTNKLASVDPETLELSEHTLPAEGALPRRLEITEDGRVWYSDYARGRIGRYNPDTGDFAEWELPSGEDSAPYGTALDDDGIMWLVESGVRPNQFVGFDTESEKIISITPIPSGGGTVRHMDYHAPSGTVWFGTDTGTIGKADVAAAAK